MNIKTICPYDCPSSCGMIAEVENGRILRMRADRAHPVSKNGICNKMQQYEKSIYSSERILTPLKRTGRKGDGQFEPISWEDAIRLITDRWKIIIKTDGAEAILPCTYSGVMSDIQRHCGDAFFNRMGATGLVRTLCSSAKGAAYGSVVGNTGCLDPEELNESDFYLIWGSNLAATRVQTLADLMKKENRNKQKILIDVYANPTAAYCQKTICIRPGTDGALALTMMHILDREGFVDEDFMSHYTEGFEMFRDTLKQYTPAWAAEETGIPEETIIELAMAYGQADAPAIILGSGNSRHGNGAMTVRLIIILSMMTGAWKKPGGGFCGCSPMADKYIRAELIKRPDFLKEPVRMFNINQIGMALSADIEKPVKSFYVYGCNPANTVSDQRAVIRGLEREDLFTVVHERFMTDTARYADIILPACFSVEQSDIYRAYGYCTFATAHKVVNAPGTCKSNWDTFCLLAQAMGYEEDYFKRTEDEMLQYMLDHPTEAVSRLSEADRQTLQEGGTVRMPFAEHLVFGTPSGKARIVDDAMKTAVPCYERHYGGSYPLSLVAAPGKWSLNSTFLDREDLMKKRGDMTLYLHPEDAGMRQIADGDQVIVWNDLAQVIFTARLTDTISKGAVAAEGVYSLTQSKGCQSVNALTHQRLSDEGEATTLNDNTVDVRRI